MAVRASRLVSALTAGGVLAGSLLLGSGAAQAAPQPPGGGTVPATCGQTVTAYPGDRVKVTPKIGIPFIQSVTPGMGSVAMTVSGLLCSVNVKVLVPVQQQLVRVAPPLGTVTSSVTEGAGQVLTPKSKTAPSSLVPAPRAAAPAMPPMMIPGRAPVSTLPGGSPMSTLPTGGLSASSPLLAPAFANELPSSFLSSASPAAGAGGVATSAPVDAGSLFGSAFPGLRAGAPAFMGYDPASAVTTASQVQALPVDGFSDGVGIPAVLAVLALSGAAAFAVRRMVLGKSLLPSALAAGAGAAPLASAPSLPVRSAAPAPAPAEETALVPAEQTALVAPVEEPAEQTALVAPVEEPSERTALVAPVEDPAEVTSVTPPVPALDPAEVTAVTPAVPALDPAEVTAVTPVVEQEPAEAPALDPAEVTGVIGAPVETDDSAVEPEGLDDAEVTGVLASTASR